MGRKGMRQSRAMAVTEARQKVWTAMRRLPSFMPSDLVSVAEVGKDNVRKYLKALQGAGYLRLLQPAVGKAGGDAVWKLIRNTGPVAPRIALDGQVYDENRVEPRPKKDDRPLVKAAPAMLKKLRELVDLADQDAAPELLHRAIDGARLLIPQAEGRA